MILESCLLDLMVDEEISCFLSLAKLIHQKTQRFTLVVIGLPNPSVLRYLATYRKQNQEAKVVKPEITSHMAFEVHGPVESDSNTLYSENLKFIAEGDHRFFSVLSHNSR